LDPISPRLGRFDLQQLPDRTARDRRGAVSARALRHPLILFHLYVDKNAAAKKRLLCRTRPELAVEMLAILRNRHDN